MIVRSILLSGCLLCANFGKVVTTSLAIALGLSAGIAAVRLNKDEKITKRM